MLEMNRLIVSAVAAALETASVAAPESARPALVPAPQKVEWKTGACPADGYLYSKSTASDTARPPSRRSALFRFRLSSQSHEAPLELPHNKDVEQPQTHRGQFPWGLETRLPAASSAPM